MWWSDFLNGCKSFAQVLSVSSLSSVEGETEKCGCNRYSGEEEFVASGMVCECVTSECGFECVCACERDSRASLNRFPQVAVCPAPCLLQASAQMPYLKLYPLSPSPQT